MDFQPAPLASVVAFPASVPPEMLRVRRVLMLVCGVLNQRSTKNHVVSLLQVRGNVKRARYVEGPEHVGSRHWIRVSDPTGRDLTVMFGFVPGVEFHREFVKAGQKEGGSVWRLAAGKRDLYFGMNDVVKFREPASRHDGRIQAGGSCAIIAFDEVIVQPNTIVNVLDVIVPARAGRINQPACQAYVAQNKCSVRAVAVVLLVRNGCSILKQYGAWLRRGVGQAKNSEGRCRCFLLDSGQA